MKHSHSLAKTLNATKRCSSCFLSQSVSCCSHSRSPVLLHSSPYYYPWQSHTFSSV